jgi:predicted nuclease of restriction endonuclease-like RecB superfamily
MTTTNKYHAHRSFYDDQWWDSDLELDFYKRLQQSFTYQPNNETKVIVKPRILVKPEAEVFPKRYWKCDFRLSHQQQHINIEVKGFLTRDFMMMFELFEYANPLEFSKTYIASENDDVRRKYAKLGKRFIWLPDATTNFTKPTNW